MKYKLSIVMVCASTLVWGNTARPQDAVNSANALNITVLTGENGTNIAGSGTFAETIVEVRDGNDTPVGAGATVTFGVAWDSGYNESGTPGTFAGGSSTLTTTTDRNGRATMTGFRPLGSGRISINVEAAYQGNTARCAIEQTNYPTEAAARAAGRNPGNGQASRAVLSAPPPAVDRRSATSIDLDPFARLARIPLGFDPSSIRFHGIKAVTVPTELVSTMAPRYCEEAAFREDTSMYCPQIRPAAFTRAYQVTYWFQGQPLGSDEYGGTYFTFSVYFRPDELSPAVRAAISAREKARADVAPLFAITTSRESQRQVVIDDANSSFCSGNYNMDGLWVHSDPGCQDRVTYKTITVPSEYVTLKVEPAFLDGSPVIHRAAVLLAGPRGTAHKCPTARPV